MMRFLTSQTNKTSIWGGPLQRRIMLRLVPILFVAFAALSAIAIQSIRAAEFEDLETSSINTLNTLDRIITTEITSTADQLVDLANSPVARQYASLVSVQNSGEGAVLVSRQLDFLRSLNDLVARNRLNYQTVRYIDVTGQVSIEITNRQGETVIDTQGYLQDDPSIVTAILENPPGTPVITRIQATTIDTPGFISVVVPVSDVNATTSIGAIQLELRFVFLQSILSDALSDPSLATSTQQLMIVNADGQIILNAGVTNTEDILNRIASSSRLTNVDQGDNQFLYTRPLDLYEGVGFPWVLVIQYDRAEAIQELNLVTGVVLFSILGTVMIVIGMIGLLLRALLKPVADAQAMAQHMAAGDTLDIGATMPLTERGEIGDLLRALGEISTRIEAIETTSQQKIQQRTRNLELTARIGRAVATLHDIDLLLNRAINLICDEFGFYHAQVFLIDDVGDNALLIYSRGEAGQRLLEQHFKISVGSESVVGMVAATGKPVIVNDTQQRTGTPHRHNPILAETRAELGLPLISGERIIGVLDVQSKQPQAFNEEDLPTFNLMADQLAVAINNARVVSQTEQRIQQISALNNQLNSADWNEKDQQAQMNRGYTYNLLDIEASTDDQPANSTAHGLVSEIRIRNQVIGTLIAEPDRGHEFSDGDEVVMRSVADRVALAIENARLFQETQTTLTETSMLYQLSRYLNDANTLEDILQAIIDSVIPQANGAQIWLFDDYHTNEHPQWMELLTDLAGDDRSTNNEDISGMRLRLQDHTYLTTLDDLQISLVNDVREDNRLDTGLKLVFRRVNAEALALIPLSVRGRWRGIIMITFAQSRTFSDREGRIFNALIDQSGVAIDNRLLLEQTEEEVARNENLYAASRLINTAQSMSDLVYSIVATNSNPDLEFSLSLLEGELDETGWPRRARLVAESKGAVVQAKDQSYPIFISKRSAMRNREPDIIIDEMPGNENVSEPVKWIRSQGYRFVAYFPLFTANRPIAIFHVMSEEAVELVNSDYEVYRALTGQMSSQIQIRGLLEETERALDETRRLYVAASAISAAQTTEGVYEAVVEHLARPFIQRQTRGTLAQRIEFQVLLAWPEPDQESPLLEYAYVWDSEERVRTEQVGQHITSEDFPYGRLTSAADGTVYVADVTTSQSQLDAVPNLRAYLLEHNVNSLLVQPIRSRQIWFGVIIGFSDHPDAFDEQYLRFIEAIADQMALSIENQRLFEQSRREADRAQSEAQRALALAEAAQLASRIGDDFERSLSDVFERIALEAGFDRWMLLFLDDARENLEKVTVEAPGFDNSRPLSYTIDTRIPVVEAAAQNRIITVNDPINYPSFAEYGDIERRGIAYFFGKHISLPVTISGTPLGSLFVGRSLESEDLNERDEQFVTTLAAQVAVAVENRRLFDRVQREQQNLRAILETLPAGVLVFDPQTLKPMQFNEQAQMLLGQEIELDTPFSIGAYNLYRTGTQLPYPEAEMSIFNALERGKLEMIDDAAVIVGNLQIDLQISAAPIKDFSGNITAIVAVFQDISNLRSLENTLQENLRETVANLEAQRQLAEAEGLDEVLDVILIQMTLIQPMEAYVITPDDSGTLECNRHMITPLVHTEMLRPLFQNDATSVADIFNDPRLDVSARAELESMNLRSVAVVPLRILTRGIFGWLMIAGDEIEPITEDQARQLSQLADTAATAIDNRLLIQSQAITVREVELLYQATTTISRSTGDVDQLAHALQSTLGLLNPDPDYYAGYLDTTTGFSNAGDNLELFSITAANVPDVAFAPLLLDYPIAPNGVYHNDLSTLPHPDEVQQQLLAAGVRSFAAINLRPKDAPGGFLVVAYRQPHPFTQSEERFLNTVADSASIVFNNILLFEQTQATLDETSTLYQASKALSDATNPEQIMNVVVNHLVGSHVNQVFIALLNGLDWHHQNAAVEVVAGWNEDAGVDLRGVTLTRDQFPAWEQLATREVLTFDDIYADETLDIMVQTGIESLDARSLIIIPLRVSNRAIGSVWIGSHDPYYHTERDLRTYQAFAEQASLSMEASYLLQQTERRARQLQTSAQVSRNAAQILDLEELMPSLVDLIKNAFGYDHVQIFLMDDRDEYAVLRASTGEPGRQLLEINHKLALGSDSVIGKVTELGTAQIALDTADANVVHQPNAYLPLTRSEMALPLIIQGNVVGALDVQSNAPNAFSEEDVKALETLAAQISVAIDNANLYESAQSQANRMSFLFAMTSTAAAANTLQETLSNIATRLQERMNSLSVVIYLPRVYADDEGNSFTTLQAVTLAGIDLPISGIEEIRMDDKTNLITEIARSRQPFVLDNIDERDNYLSVAPEAQSAMLLPLITGGELIGMIVVEAEHIRAFDRDTLQLLVAMGGSVAAILQSSRLVEQLQQTTEELRELDRLKSDFLANMSHELRTPLNSIIGFSRVMLKGIDGPLTEMQEQDLTTIYNSGQHLLTLINDVLDQAKIAANKLDLKFAHFEIKPVVEAVRSIAVGLVKDKNISLITEIAPNLPNVYGDEVRTRQVLLNLVSNAAKFTSVGGIVIRAYPVTLENGQKHIRVDVEDTGIGIADSDLPLLFEAFRQVDSSLTRTQGGTGLGLPIAKSLTEMQGGYMFVESEVNVGSVFSITLPLEPSAAEMDHDEDSDDKASDEAREKNRIDEPTKPTMEMKALSPSAFGGPPPQMMQAKREVLLIEDNKDMVDQFRRVLQREGFDVTTADHPAYAGAMVSNLRPTLIIMDVNFGGGQGWNLLTNLKDRDDTFDIPIVVVTLNNESERAYQAGAHSFIQRPFLQDDLLKAVLAAEVESNMERILIIDDQPNDVRLLTQLLNDNGTYRVFSAPNGKEGVSLVARRRPDLVILDLRMPEMDGFAVLKELRSNPETANIPVLIVTGEVDLNDDEQQQLANVRVLAKTDISDEEYEAFIADIRKELDMR